MNASAFGVVGATAARNEIGGVGGERLVDGDRLAAVGVLAPGEFARSLDRLPIVEDVVAIGEFEIVGDADALEPGATTTEHAPCSRDLRIAPIREPDTRRQASGVWSLARCQFRARGLAVELDLLGHAAGVLLVSRTGGNPVTRPETSIDGMPGFTRLLRCAETDRDRREA